MRRRRAAGFTLIEVLVVLGIVALAMSGAVMGMRSLVKTDLRAASSKLAASMRYLFDRARTTGSAYRLVLDLETGKYWAEQASGRFTLTRDKERSAKPGQAPERKEEEGAAQEEQAKRDETEDLVDAQGSFKLGPPKVLFKTFTESNLKPVQLPKRVKIEAVFTPKQLEPYTSGRAYVYFFPQGFSERALVHLSDGKESFYSLELHPLTGRVIVQSGQVPFPRDLGERDDEGRKAP